MTEHTSNHSHHAVSEEHEKIKLPLVFSLLIISAIIFLITLSGITDQLSNWIMVSGFLTWDLLTEYRLQLISPACKTKARQDFVECHTSELIT